MYVWKLILLGLLAQLAATAVLSPDGAMMCSVDGSHFSYVEGQPDGPSAWSTISDCCGGSRQSPRNIITNDPFTTCDASLLSNPTYNGSTKVTGKLYNKGHDPILEFSGGAPALLDGAPHTNGTYTLSNIHIHFNSAGGQGSEHSIDYQFYDAEVHLVHYKQEYGSVAEAVLHPDGLVVIALMLEVTNGTPNHEIVKLIDEIPHVSGIGSAGAVSYEVDLTQLLPASPEYYTYAGSLTTPPCSETVRWVIMKEPVHIHQHQLDVLASLESSDGGLISDHSNDRPLQIGDTMIETNFDCNAPLI